MFNNSILLSVQKDIGPSAEYEEFRQVIINHINTVIAELTQIGVGPSEGFYISDESSTWSDFVEPKPKWLPVITFVCNKVHLRFDPPNAGQALTALKETVEEDEWRISFTVESEVHSNV